jgi:hypothetical protein
LIAFAGIVAGPVNAGSRGYGYRGAEYYVDVDYPPRRPSRAWYSSSCCYMKIVRHVGHKRQVRYVKVKPWRMKQVLLEQKRERERAARRKRLRKRAIRRDRAGRYAKYEVIVVRRNGDGVRKRCRHRRVRVLKPGGGWTWAVRARCE